MCVIVIYRKRLSKWVLNEKKPIYLSMKLYEWETCEEISCSFSSVVALTEKEIFFCFHWGKKLIDVSFFFFSFMTFIMIMNNLKYVSNSYEFSLMVSLHAEEFLHFAVALNFLSSLWILRFNGKLLLLTRASRNICNPKCGHTRPRGSV